MIPSALRKYLEKYARHVRYPLVSGPLAGIDQVVIIPALAERAYLFATLSSLSKNPREDLARCLVLCVVNNRRPGLSHIKEIRDNQETMQCLSYLVNGTMPQDTSASLRSDLRAIRCSGLRCAFIDASSPGNELPDQEGGVGLARKIGLDAGLSLLDYQGMEKKLLCCLDADTLVQDNYLSAVRAFMEKQSVKGAVVAYSHPEPADPMLKDAICGYEIFLRYYVLGLSYAASPYAFHSIGSTMVCTAEGYMAVHGMNRRRAAEDFYFLNKLAKISPIGRIRTTTVYPSPRPSRRVPFGTGQRMIRFMEGSETEYRLYDPAVFDLLKQLLGEVTSNPCRDGCQILSAMERIHPRLGHFLRGYRFEEVWRKIRENSPGPEHLNRQFHTWFDGFKTLKLIHDLTGNTFPAITLREALKGLLRQMDRPFPLDPEVQETAETDPLWRILHTLRELSP